MPENSLDTWYAGRDVGRAPARETKPERPGCSATRRRRARWQPQTLSWP